jgi:hypothetical protein
LESWRSGRGGVEEEEEEEEEGEDFGLSGEERMAIQEKEENERISTRTTQPQEHQRKSTRDALESRLEGSKNSSGEGDCCRCILNAPKKARRKLLT